MISSSNLKLFGTVPADGAQKPFERVGVIGTAPRTFIQGTQLAIDALSIVWFILILRSLAQSPLLTVLLTEALYLLSLLCIVLARRSARFTHVLLYNSAAVLLSLLLNILLPGDWGNIWLIGICGLAIYQLPLRWAWPFALAGMIGTAATNGIFQYFFSAHSGNLLGLFSPLLICLFLCWIGFSRRNRDLLVIELQHTQEQLRAEMARTEELATTRERARIARDIHDVLAHTLTILSVQIQATRQLMRQDPERAAAKLDDMATLLKESLAESRRVVGLLRETTLTAPTEGDVGKQLHQQAERFNERTGIRCTFEEQGKAQPLGEKARETLQFALQEALTNAHRHGAAKQVEIMLRWEENRVQLRVQDNGQRQAGKSEGSHQGLRGMRERVEGLGGTMQAGPGNEGGFEVSLWLPVHMSGQ
jgi:signal transduction histidine kinase